MESGIAFALGTCYCCHQPMTFNPVRVPVYTGDGTREPICFDCVTIINAQRKKLGYALIQVLPGAYEPWEAAEL